jgi:hypothetical protein
LVASITQAEDTGEEHDFGRALRELEVLGYRPAALGLKAHFAMRAGNRLDELVARSQLADVLRPNSLSALPAPERHVRLLLDFGQLELALELVNQASNNGSWEATWRTPPWLEAALEALRNDRPVVFAGPAQAEHLEQQIAAARILRRPMMGWHELHRSDGAMLPDVRLGPTDLASAIQHSLPKSSAGCVQVAAPPILWIENEAVEAAQGLLLWIDGEASWTPLKVLLRMQSNPSGTELTRSVLLDPRPADRAASDMLLDDRLRQAIRIAAADGARSTVLALINGPVHSALRRLRTLAVARAACRKGEA